MEMSFDKTTILNTSAQTDLVKNSIIWQCIYVLQTVSEFRNLTHRVTKTWNDMEMVVVYREGVLGIFGPPVDPITLMLDQKGKCLLSIPFKPVQRVSIVSPEYGHVEISSLLTVLRMVAGNGYLFCPGIPERFLIGKACSKFVVLHKVPFKRYQSTLCPVYYQALLQQQKNAKSSLCALCPRCMQVAKWIQSLPVISANGTGKAAQLTSAGYPQDDKKSVLDSSISNSAITSQQVKEYDTVPSALLSFPPSFSSSSITPLPVGPQYVNSGNNMPGQKVSKLDVNGNNETTVEALRNSSCSSDHQTVRAEDIKSPVSAKILETKSYLRNLLQRTIKRKLESSDEYAETKDLKISNKDTTTPVNNNKLKRLNSRQKNICRHCRKEFSTPANLMNHFQRHEALSGSWCKQFKERKLLRSSTSYPKVVFRRSKLSSFLHGKKPVQLSETTIRLFLKYLNDLIVLHKGAKSLMRTEYTSGGIKYMNNEAEKHIELKHERSHSYLYEQTEHEALEKRYGHKRTLSGLSPMQTLLKAAFIADVDNDVTSPTISSSSAKAIGKHHEMAVVSSTTQSPTSQQELIEANIPEKEARKSLRLASKKNKSNKKKSRVIHNESAQIKNEATPESHPILTNLNLLSAVSITKAMRDTQASTQNSVTVSQSIPTSLSLNIKTRAANLPTSDCVSNNQNMLDTFHSSLMITGYQQKEPFTNMNVSSCSDFPVLPSLFQEANSVYPFLTHKQQGQPQSVSPTSSLFMTTLGNQPQPVSSTSPLFLTTKSNNLAISESFVVASKMDESSNNSCGAIDLSKPKASQMAANIQSLVENRPDLPALPKLPHNIAQLVTSNNPAALQYLMMSKAADQSYKESHPLTSNVQADHSLQPNLFAPAQNYKSDKGGKNAAQVQSVIAATSGSTMPGKVKSGGGLARKGDEIQCGYKWTGSGGLVKERTQMVRELVPSHVMANFLSKSWTPANVTQPISVNTFSNSQPPMLSPQTVPSSRFMHAASTKPQNMSASHYALNLTMSKSSEMLTKDVYGLPQKSAQLVLTSPSSHVYKSTPVPPVSAGMSILKLSTPNPFGAVSQHTSNIPTPSDIRAHSTTINLKKKRQRIAQHPESSYQSSSLLPTATTTFSSCTISSPSLAAMLLQPTLPDHEIVPNDTSYRAYHTEPSPKTLNNKDNTFDSYASSSSTENSSVKTEPVDSHIPEQDVTLMILPIKPERWDSDTIRSAASPDYDRSPPNLVVAINPELLSNKEKKGKGSNLGSNPISRAADFVS